MEKMDSQGREVVQRLGNIGWRDLGARGVTPQGFRENRNGSIQ
jgi:hypothetical protein